MKVITITNQKGGVAKTTTAAALGFGLAEMGYKVLFVDTDAQCNLTETVYPVDEHGNIKYDFNKTIFELMLRECKVEDTICHSKYDRVDIIPASIYLTEIDMRLVTAIRRENIIADALMAVQNDYDFCVIDTPPSLGWMTINAIVASDYLIIPTFTEKFSLNGIQQLYDNYTSIKNTINPKLNILGFLITRNKGKTALARDLKEVLSQFAEEMGTKIFETVIREQVAVNEAQLNEVNIYDYMKKARKTIRGNVSEDYRNFVNEVLVKIGVK